MGSIDVALIDRLERLLEDQDAAARELLDDLPAGETVTAIREAMARWDFDEALAAVGRLRQARKGDAS